MDVSVAYVGSSILLRTDYSLFYVNLKNKGAEQFFDF